MSGLKITWRGELISRPRDIDWAEFLCQTTSLMVTGEVKLEGPNFTAMYENGRLSRATGKMPKSA